MDDEAHYIQPCKYVKLIVFYGSIFLTLPGFLAKEDLDFEQRLKWIERSDLVSKFENVQLGYIRVL